MNEAKVVKAVFDCNVFLQAASRETSVAAKCLRMVEKGLVQLYLSEDVLNRPAIRNHFQTLTDEIVEAFLLRLQNNAEIICSVLKKIRVFA